MSQRLKGKVAIVFGAGSIAPGWGNGKAAAVLFAREGAKVLCVDLVDSAADETAAIIRQEGGDATACSADASASRDVAMAIEKCTSTYGTINILHNNVGIVATGGVVDLEEDEWDRQFRINLKSCFLTMKHVIPVMMAHGGGSIVNVSSTASLAYMGVPYCSYASSKAGMNQLTKVTAVEYASHNIRVNAVLPGFMRTPMVEHYARTTAVADAYAKGDIEEMYRVRDREVPLGRHGEAWDVAFASLFLASDEAKYITGSEIVVDGGLTAKVV